ncbi:MAG TPA: hypothetical protein VL832_12530 [Puia sp.]|nr:hypothetical protein [Puia sp.]
MRTRFFGLVLCMFFVCGKGMGQNDYYPDSLKKSIPLAKTDEEKITTCLWLAAYYGGTNDSLSERYASQGMELAEMSRNRRLMVIAYVKNGRRYLGQAELAGNILQAIDNFQHAEKVAKENGLDKDLVDSYCGLSEAYVAKGENDKALNYNNLALSVAGNLDNDTAKVVAYYSMGACYVARNEKLLAFRNYLEALNIAELSKKEKLIARACKELAGFYQGIGDQDKAIDYELRAIDIDRKNNDRIELMRDYNDIGQLFTQKKQYDLGLKMFESSIAVADTIRFDLYKINSYINIFSMYFSADQYAKGISYLREHREVENYMKKAGLSFFTDEAFGVAYTGMKKFDSAYYYFKKTESDFEKRGSAYMKSDFYEKFGDYYQKKGDLRMAIDYYLKDRAIGQGVGSLTILQKSAGCLDTLYDQAGDYKTAYFYNTEYSRYTDSIKTLAKETDLQKLEVDNDNRRRERLAREEEENVQHRHNVQYMGFTVGLVGLFVSLVMMGFFVVSPRTIRALGFFSFIFLFEFIILLADKQIHEATHGEPWKVLLIKVLLAAILLPLHHWLEHKVIHYLTSRRKIVTPGLPFRKKAETDPAATAGEETLTPGVAE